MRPMTVGEICAAVQGVWLNPREDAPAVTAVCTDSRKLTPGCLFLPWVGERFDGHDFIDAALEAGAAGCLCARVPETLREDRFYIQVPDTRLALRDLASANREAFAGPVVQVTGSVGKTTTKEMIAAVLGARLQTWKTPRNFNNDVGTPLTLLGLEDQQAAVIETGMNHFGEIEYLGSMVRPDVAVITNIGDAHIEFLGSREGILKAKCELLPHIKENGLVVLNGDDPLLSALRGRTPVPALFCGQGEGCDYRAQVTGGDGFSHIHCRLTTPNMEREVKIPALGEHMIYPTLIAAAVGERFGLTPSQIEEGIGQFVPTRMRMNVLRRGNSITILDDTYNANPQSMRAAISVLADSQSRFKAAILGDMLELGPFAPALHAGVGEYLGTVGVDCLVAVGELSSSIVQGARDAGVPQVIHCKTREEAKEVLPQVVRPDSTILVKASRGMKLEELTARLLELTAEP